MSNTPVDCSAIEKRLDEHTLYISTTRDQLAKLDPGDPDIQNKRAALTRKLDALQEQVNSLQRALEDCRQGKGANLPPFEVAPENESE